MSVRKSYHGHLAFKYREKKSVVKIVSQSMMSNHPSFGRVGWGGMDKFIGIYASLGISLH